MTKTVDVQPPSPRGFFRSRVARLAALLRQGHTPEKLALSVALGITLGLFPILGTTTILCVIAGLVLRLNHPALQLTNQLMYPLQIPLIVAFIRLGDAMLGAAPIPFSATVLVAEMRAHPTLFFERFGTAGLHGILGWAMVAPIVAAAAYAAVLPLLRVLSRRPDAAAVATIPTN